MLNKTNQTDQALAQPKFWDKDKRQCEERMRAIKPILDCDRDY